MKFFKQKGGKKIVHPSIFDLQGVAEEESQAIYHRYDNERLRLKRQDKPKLITLLSYTPGGRHALYQTSVGIIRKPIAVEVVH